MRTHASPLDNVLIYEPEPEEGHLLLEWWAEEGYPPLALDTESTGLDLWSPSWRLTLVQVGTAAEVWVLDPRWHREVIVTILDKCDRFVAHNVTFDLLALERAGLVADFDLLWRRFTDTRTLAHLLDPRSKQEGGVGHGLKDLARVHVAASAPDSEAALKAVFAANRWKPAEGWSKIDPHDPTLVTYAGTDVAMTARLHEVLGAKIEVFGLARLAAWEREVAWVCARMERAGLLVDPDWLTMLAAHYEQVEQEALKDARLMGVVNVNSAREVAESLQALGADLVERTPSGAPKVDKAVLQRLAAEGNILAETIITAKRAAKWRTAYVLPMLQRMTDDGRIHPRINALQARTARMSVTDPPLQQLPSGDWRIRRAIVAPEGRLVWSADFAQVELRVLAALAQEDTMLDVIERGEDLHDATARILFGPDFTKAQRKLAKAVGFGRVYGGGAATLSRQAGVDEETARMAMSAYDDGFPGITRYARALRYEVEHSPPQVGVRTVTGRNIPVDPDRSYAATNYVVQSTSRDLLAQALLDLVAAGFEPGTDLLLPIHDEVLGTAPADEAEDRAREAARVMSRTFTPYKGGRGVQIVAESEVYGPSWGHGYGAQGQVAP